MNLLHTNNRWTSPKRFFLIYEITPLVRLAAARARHVEVACNVLQVTWWRSLPCSGASFHIHSRQPEAGTHPKSSVAWGWSTCNRLRNLWDWTWYILIGVPTTTFLSVCDSLKACPILESTAWFTCAMFFAVWTYLLDPLADWTPPISIKSVEHSTHIYFFYGTSYINQKLG